MLTETVKQLESHKNDVLAKIASLQSEVSKIDEAVAVLESVNSGESTHVNGGVAEVIAEAPTGGKKRGISAAGIARIKAAQKLRWAKFKKAAPEAAPEAKSKPKFSAAGIAKIRAAQKLRWAKYNAAKGK